MATTLGPLVALRGNLLKTHQGFAWPLEDSQLLVESDGAKLFLVEFSSARVVQALLSLAQPAWVYVAEIVREDAHQYFGFSSALDRALFEEIKEIKDIGPKTSALVVAELGGQGLMRLLQEGAWHGLKIPGVGPKTLDTLVFGLGKRKKSLLPLLDRAMSTRVESKKRAETPTESGASVAASVVEKISVETSWRPSLYASDALIKMFEGLGLAPPQAQKLFDECLEAFEGFAALDDKARVPVMLQRWGQSRWVRDAGKGI
jgi:Holliday junction resolvasome RuvABC DNA-binding subunit